MTERQEAVVEALAYLTNLRPALEFDGYPAEDVQDAVMIVAGERVEVPGIDAICGRLRTLGLVERQGPAGRWGYWLLSPLGRARVGLPT